MTYSLDEINQMDREAFVSAFGAVFEATPGIAAVAWQQRPFANGAALKTAMLGTMRGLSPEEQLALICAHPDLGSRAKMAPASVAEQAIAGLDQLTVEEFERFQQLNGAYKAKFGFPFIIAVKHHTKASILAAFEQRLGHGKEVEQATAMEEIAQIAALRLAERLQD